MRIHKEGHKFLFYLFLIAAALSVLAYTLIPKYAWFVYSVSGAIWLFLVSFFRIPKRIYTEGTDLIVAPADGKVVVIEETEEIEYFKDKRIQISIFMSPLNVHVNRAPISGSISYEKYHPGDYLVAWDPKSSTKNERNTVVFKNSTVEILARQIAGKLARKIVSYAKIGQEYSQNDDFGFIKLGSRVDLFLPLDSEIKVNLNQTVKGGQSIIAKIK